MCFIVNVRHYAPENTIDWIEGCGSHVYSSLKVLTPSPSISLTCNNKPTFTELLRCIEAAGFEASGIK